MYFHGSKGLPHNHIDTQTDIEDKLSSEAFLKVFELGLPALNRSAIEQATSDILTAVGEDVRREGLLKTPDRVARMYEELLGGYRVDPAKLINGALFDVDYDDMVIVKDIEFSSLCEHHMLPFIGHAHVAYVPRGKVIGLSKIPRIVDMFGNRLQVQERMTRQIADFINEVLDPRGVAVVIEGKHMCSMMRGVEKHDSSMTTSTMIGVFREDASTRAEFLSHLNRQGHFGL
jgi:GTP cyclohydrolase I